MYVKRHHPLSRAIFSSSNNTVVTLLCNKLFANNKANKNTYQCDCEYKLEFSLICVIISHRIEKEPAKL